MRQWRVGSFSMGLILILAGNEQFKFKYDGWPIFLMIVLFLFCLGSCSLSYSGVIPHIR